MSKASRWARAETKQKTGDQRQMMFATASARRKIAAAQKARRAKLEAGQAEGGVDLGRRLRVTRQSSGTPPQLRTTSLNLQHVGRADMLKWFCASQDTISTGGDDHVSPTKRCIHAALVQRSLE
jgi:hypothetical protein